MSRKKWYTSHVQQEVYCFKVRDTHVNYVIVIKDVNLYFQYAFFSAGRSGGTETSLTCSFSLKKNARCIMTDFIQIKCNLNDQ